MNILVIRKREIDSVLNAYASLLIDIKRFKDDTYLLRSEFC